MTTIAMNYAENGSEVAINHGKPRHARLRLVDGSIMCWSEMLRLFRDLLPLMPDVLLCVINGSQWIDNRNTSRYLEEFSAYLQEHIRPTETMVIETLDRRDASSGLDRNN
ncbi:hypothetical protein F5X96DRAFT_672390 [Biscogniauxia mediterranea]|nr:hypothetical protein F5X96DRAFT_672390 [Biscogniauxia mediterranea]